MTTRHIVMLAVVLSIRFGYSCFAQDKIPAGPATVQLTVVKGAPFSALVVTESTRLLADGNRIVSKKTASIARDIEGRTRREQSLSTDSSVASTVFIQDPVAAVTYLLDPRSRTARKIELPKPPPSDAGAAISRAQQKTTIETEPLGTQIIDGIEVQGTRIKRTIPAGQAGNERPIEVVLETWYSPELQTVLISKNVDPRTGETVYKLTDIQRIEPARSLFEVPPEYTIREDPAEIRN